MSDDETAINSSDLLTTEYRDGQLQIVEVAQYGSQRGKILGSTSQETQILPELDSGDMGESRYVQVLNSDKSVVQLDLLNMTLVKCDDGSDTTYKLVANTEAPAGTEIPSDATLTCVLQSDDQEEEDPDNQDTYVVMNGGEGAPLMFLKSDFEDGSVEVVKGTEEKQQTKKPTPVEILAKAKALQKKAQLLQSAKQAMKGRRGRKLKSNFPPPHELLASPNFKLFLYSCKMCHFKCNAIKEMTQHKATEHSSGSRARAGRGSAVLQCARCPYKATTHIQLVRHVQERHRNTDEDINIVNLNSEDIDEAQVLVCGACGYECTTKLEFKKHIKNEHGATVVSMSI